MARSYRFQINISREKYLHYYAGEATSIQVHSEDGILIQFPASALKKFVTHQGISGKFRISFDENNKLINLQQFD